MRGGAEHESASRRLSELLRTRTSLERFASLFWCYYERAAQTLWYVNVGHLPPMLVRQNDGGELEIQRLTEGGPVLGLLKGADYRQGHASVRPGDLLLLYSDGVVEAESPSGDQFEEARLLAVRDTPGPERRRKSEMKCSGKFTSFSIRGRHRANRPSTC
jgi:phosphoserine phosphatase RsbU/P